MIKQLNTAQYQHRSVKDEWPEADKTTGLFSSRKPLRKIRVLVDAELLKGQPGTSSTLGKAFLLYSLLENELVEYYLFANDGPPDGTEPMDFSGHRLKPPHPIYKGWATLYPKEHGFYRPVLYAHDDDSYAVSGTQSTAPDVVASDKVIDARSPIPAAQREADVLALHVASEGVTADLFITERAYLLGDNPLASEKGVTVCTPDEAIAVLSLYMRTQGVFPLPTGSRNVRHTMNKGLFYWVGARELLPAGWRWHTACVRHSSGVDDNKLMLLSSSTLSRVARALQARDEVHIALNGGVNNDYSDDALGSLDNALLMLLGAVDASACVAHHVLGFDPSKDYQAGWQKWRRGQWMQDVDATAPALVDVVRNGTDNERALTILRLLRNSVHGIALQGVSYRNGSHQEILLGLPKDDEAEILGAMDALGGRTTWGFRPITPQRNHIEPAVLIDKLFEATMKHLDDLMKATPVEGLTHASLSAADALPPMRNADPFNDMFSETNRLAIRWQLGF